MLAKSKRLNLKKDFKWVVSGAKTEDQIVKLFWRVGDNPLPRVGIAVSGSVFKKAVLRNRARRLVAAGFKMLYDSLAPGINIIAMPKAEIIKVGSKEVVDYLQKQLKERGLVKKGDAKGSFSTD